MDLQLKSEAVISSPSDRPLLWDMNENWHPTTGNLPASTTDGRLQRNVLYAGLHAKYHRDPELYPAIGSKQL